MKHRRAAIKKDVGTVNFLQFFFSLGEKSAREKISRGGGTILSERPLYNGLNWPLVVYRGWMQYKMCVPKENVKEEAGVVRVELPFRPMRRR
jgi:hypothetical protein